MGGGSFSPKGRVVDEDDDDRDDSLRKDSGDEMEKKRQEAKDVSELTPRSVTSKESTPFFSACGDVKRGTGNAVVVSQTQAETKKKASTSPGASQSRRAGANRLSS